MKVLHFIPNLEAVKRSPLLSYKVALLASMSGKADVTVLTCNAGKVSLDGIEIKECLASAVVIGRGRRRLRRLLTAMRPDVVHIHACWNHVAGVLFRECARLKVPTVLTVDRRLESWHVKRHYWSGKLPMSVMFQRRMLKDAGALHFITQQEQARFEYFGWHPLVKASHPINTRTVTISPFNITAGTSAETMVGSLLALYQKVADSAPFNQMSDDERKVEDLLLGISLSDNGRVTISDGDISLLRSIDGKSWRRILIHSYDENISENVYEGLRQAGMPIPAVAAGTLDRFALRACDAGGKPKDVSSDAKIARLMSDKSIPQLERGVCVELVGLLLKIRYGYAHRSDFVRLYRKLRFEDYDEDLVYGKIRGLGLAKDAARLFKIMEERYGLGQGFMFADPLDDKGTMKLREKLFKSEIQ